MLQAVWFLVPFIGMVICTCYTQAKALRIARADKYRLVRERFGAYARMKSPCATTYHPPDHNVQFVPSAMLLSAEQHDILLGALKKIEAKNAVLAAIVAFAFPILLQLYSDSSSCASMYLLLSAMGLTTALVLLSARGASHLGQSHFIRLSTKNDQAILGKELQRELLHNLLQKEAAFSLFIWTIFFVIAATLLAVILP